MVRFFFFNCIVLRKTFVWGTETPMTWRITKVAATLMRWRSLRSWLGHGPWGRGAWGTGWLGLWWREPLGASTWICKGLGLKEFPLRIPIVAAGDFGPHLWSQEPGSLRSGQGMCCAPGKGGLGKKDWRIGFQGPADCAQCLQSPVSIPIATALVMGNRTRKRSLRSSWRCPLATRRQIFSSIWPDFAWDMDYTDRCSRINLLTWALLFSILSRRFRRLEEAHHGARGPEWKGRNGVVRAPQEASRAVWNRAEGPWELWTCSRFAYVCC